NTCGADRAWAATALDAIGTGFNQRQRRFASGDVAADHLHLREVLLHPAHALDNALGMAVSSVHHHHIDASSRQRFDALGGVCASTDGSADTQAALLLLRRHSGGLALAHSSYSPQTAE